MKTTLSTLLILAACTVLAQDPDSTANPVKRDTIPDQKVEPSKNPTIIYYKSNENDRKKERRRDIKTLSGSLSHSGGFGALSFRSTEFRDETVVLAGLRGGWIINRTLAIGLEGHGIIPTAEFSDVSVGEDVALLGGYGGMFLELIFFSNEVIHLTVPVSAGAGWLGYDRSIPEDNLSIGEAIVDEDIFWYVEPGVDVEINIARNFRLALGVSKRITQDLELQATDAKDFDKLNYFLTLKIGGF